MEHTLAEKIWIDTHPVHYNLVVLPTAQLIIETYDEQGIISSEVMTSCRGMLIYSSQDLVFPGEPARREVLLWEEWIGGTLLASLHHPVSGTSTGQSCKLARVALQWVEQVAPGRVAEARACWAEYLPTVPESQSPVSSTN